LGALAESVSIGNACGKNIPALPVDPPGGPQHSTIVRSGLPCIGIIVHRDGEVEALMALALQVVSSHLLGAREIEQALSVQKALGKLLLPHTAGETETVKQPNCPRLFLLDGCSLNLPLGPMSSRLRANSPGSKFLALLPPHRSGESEMMPLFHWGIDGFVTLHPNWKTELPNATMALLRGEVWVPSEVLLTFIKQMKTLLDKQLMAGESLTARECQVLQLLFRQLRNKEIAHQLRISERTAKFHVSNLLRKLGLENRRNFPSVLWSINQIKA
jgi:DNA-binding CsgD family transcriptional regulator